MGFIVFAFYLLATSYTIASLLEVKYVGLFIKELQKSNMM